MAGYFIWLGVANSGRRPRVVDGAVDLAALALGFGGVIAIGPANLLVREQGNPFWLGSIVFLVAAWGLRGLETGRPPSFEKQWSMSFDGWKRWLARLREAGEMRYDDATVLMLRVLSTG